MKIIKVISLFIAALMIFCGCETQTVTPPVTEVPLPSQSESVVDITEDEHFILRIPYDYAEGVSPYTTMSKTNRYVCELIYRSMVNLTSDYRYELDLLPI